MYNNSNSNSNDRNDNKNDNNNKKNDNINNDNNIIYIFLILLLFFEVLFGGLIFVLLLVFRLRGGRRSRRLLFQLGIGNGFLRRILALLDCLQGFLFWLGNIEILKLIPTNHYDNINNINNN